MESVVTFGAAQLVKSSARQIKWMRDNNRRPESNENQLKGEAWQHSQTQGHELSEMRGEISRDTYIMGERVNLKIRFCVDKVTEHPLMFHEYKHIDESRPVQQWYWHSALIQTAFYKAMANECSQYVTADFHVRKTGQRHIRNFNARNANYILHFGKDDHWVSGFYEPILQHFIAKAKSTFDWDAAAQWDEINKFKDWDAIGKYIVSRKLQEATK